jgi:hypothetical protein
MRTAHEKGRPLGAVLGLAARLGMVPHAFAHAFTTAHGDHVPDEHDMSALNAAWGGWKGGDGPARFREGARLQLWYLEQAAFDERFERLWPLVEQMAQLADPDA